jgi:prepilin-type N-terminal cleavage/methylation domain-containing protein
VKIEKNIGVNSMTRFTKKKYASISVNQLPWALQMIGFNLLELMIVLAIIGILSVAATLSYTKYIAQGNLTEVFGLMNHYQTDLMSAYAETQQFPSTIDDLSANSYTTLTYNTVNLVYYGVSSNKQAAYLRLYTVNTGIAGTSVSSPGVEGVASRIAVVISVTNDGHFNIKCGQWGNASIPDIPAQYLPNSCANTNLSSLIS